MEWIVGTVVGMFGLAILCYFVCAYIVMQDRKKRIAEYDDELRIVYVVTCDYYNGGHGDLAVMGVVGTELEAQRYCNKMNRKKDSSATAAHYDYDAMILGALLEEG